MYNNIMKDTKLKIYLDNCCYNRPFDEVRNTEVDMEIIAKLAIQLMVQQGKLDLVWSYVLTYENSLNPKIINKENIILWKDIACENIIENKDILSKAEEYQKNGLKSLDSLHVACAVYAKCDVFITTDKGILKKKIDDIKVLNPIDFMREVINNDD